MPISKAYDSLQRGKLMLKIRTEKLYKKGNTKQAYKPDYVDMICDYASCWQSFL